MADYVLTQDISSERVHKRFPADKGYATHEADNLDQAGPYRILNSVQAYRIPTDRWCRRCFANGPEHPDGEPLDIPEDNGSTWNETEP